MCALCAIACVLGFAQFAGAFQVTVDVRRSGPIRQPHVCMGSRCKWRDVAAYQRPRGAALMVQTDAKEGVDAQSSSRNPYMRARERDEDEWVLAERPEAFDEVLGILRELDRNGSWPTTSRRRSELLRKTTRRELVGDSFTIGLFPPPLRTPHANELLPGLLDALQRLERVLCPQRPCSTTITVNRHAEFKPHRDSGAGAGQSTSLIVGLGDYIGGALMVEGRPVDIRYKGLEFDGWREKHWTRAFRGERYSLVWYTPQGLEEAQAALERGEGWVAATRNAEASEHVTIVSKSLARLEADVAARTMTARGPITRQRFSMVPFSVCAPAYL
jgi:hypothetical protein